MNESVTCVFLTSKDLINVRRYLWEQVAVTNASVRNSIFRMQEKLNCEHRIRHISTDMTNAVKTVISSASSSPSDRHMTNAVIFSVRPSYLLEES